MEPVAYLLCAGTSTACFGLLMRGYLRSRARLLFWSSLCFLGFALENGLTFVDLVVIPNTDLSLLCRASALVGVGMMLYGLIWESR